VHVALDGRVITPHFPGIGRLTYRLVEAMAEAAPQHAFTVFVTPGQDDPRFDLAQLAQAPNVVLREVAAPVFGLATQWRLPSALRAARADLFHATYWLTPWRPGVPTVLSLYDLIGLSQPGAVPRARRLALALALRLALRTAGAVVTLSEWSRGDILARYGLSPDRVFVTPLAADPSFHPPSPSDLAAVRASLGLPARYVLYLGINKPHKNLGLLLDAWRELVPSLGQEPIALVLAGPWDRRYDHLRQQAAALPAPADVRILGPIPDSQLPALLGGAAVFAFPSRYEGFGLPPLEAMACGAPVIAAAASSLPEVVGDAGLLVSPDDRAAWAAALRQVLADPALAGALRERGLLRAKGFTWRATAERTLAAYARVRPESA
jgi:alpha-1,3-rhamnosyl/mannosyltransferase